MNGFLLLLEGMLLVTAVTLGYLSATGRVDLQAWLAVVTVLIGGVEFARRVMAKRISKDVLMSTRKREFRAASKVEGEIFSPPSGSHVDRVIPCRGRASGMKEFLHLWLMVEHGGSKWPKGKEIKVTAERKWNHTVVEGGELPQFAIGLYVADSIGQELIQRWLDDGRIADRYPPFEGSEGIHFLHRVEGLTTHPPGTTA